jgi:hypothetical protein
MPLYWPVHAKCPCFLIPISSPGVFLLFVQVVVTSVTTNSDGETVVSFVVTGLDAEDLAAVSDAVESGPFAEEVTPSHPHTHTLTHLTPCTASTDPPRRCCCPY